MRLLIAVSVAAAGIGGTALADGHTAAEKCFDKGTLTYVDCPTVAAEPLPAPDPVPPRPDWTGFYAGLHAGYGEVDFGGQALFAAPVLNLNNDVLGTGGFVGGGQIGYNHQVSDNYVIGLEIDGSWFSGDSNRVQFVAANGGSTFTTGELDAVGSARLRGGLALETWMPYITGGVALADYEVSGGRNVVGNPNFPQTVTHSEIAFGGVFGGGVEVMAFDRFTVRAEGLYYVFDESNSLTGLTGSLPGSSVDLEDFWTIRGAINYRF